MAKKLDNKFEATMKACRSARINEAASRVKAQTKKKNLKEEEEITSVDIDGTEEIDEPEDVVDDIMVVTDPDLTVDEYEDTIDDLQDIVDDTPEGEIPFTDEYIGDNVYACPVCGNNFFSDTEMNAGDTCPVCGEEADGFVLVGEVQDSEDVVDEEETEDEEDLDVDVDIEDDVTEESKAPSRKAKRGRYTPTKYSLDEKTLNPFLTKFIKENYRNAVSMTARKAIISGRNLKIECAIKFKSGKVKKTVITVENFKPAKQMKMFGKADSMFKIESKKSVPFAFEAVMIGNTIKVKSFKYSFITKKEGKRLQIFGKYALKESKKRK